MVVSNHILLVRNSCSEGEIMQEQGWEVGGLSCLLYCRQEQIQGWFIANSLCLKIRTVHIECLRHTANLQMLAHAAMDCAHVVCGKSLDVSTRCNGPCTCGLWQIPRTMDSASQCRCGLWQIPRCQHVLQQTVRYSVAVTPQMLARGTMDNASQLGVANSQLLARAAMDVACSKPLDVSTHHNGRWWPMLKVWQA